MHKLSAAYWIKSEDPYLPEYIEFHLIQGFDYFIFYENGPTDKVTELLKPYIERGLVEIRTYPSHITNRNNFWMMDHLVQEQVGKSEWIHFHATDERIYCPNGGSISDLLKDYHQYGGLCVAWEEFNSNGHKTKIPGLLTDRFTTTCRDTAQHIKTIVRPECVVKNEGDPHNFIFKPGHKSVDENHQPLVGPWHKGNYTFSKIKNHHYRTMSREEFDQKMQKGLLDHAGQENIRRHDAEQQWDWCHNRAEQGHNDFLIKYSAQIKQALTDTYKNYPELLKQVTDWYAL